MLNKEKVPIDRKLAFVNCVEANGFIWFWDMFYDALFFCKLGENVAQKVDMKSNINLSLCTFSLYSKIFLYYNKIICTPRMADKILIYDIEKKESRYVKIGIQDWDHDALKFGKFFDAIVKGKYVYFVGAWSSYLVKFDMEKEYVEKIVDLYNNLSVVKGENVFLFGNPAFIDNILLIPSGEYNIIFKVNVDNMEVSLKEIQGIDLADSDKGFSALYVENNCIWLAPKRKGAIVCWDYIKDYLVYFNNYPKDFEFSTDSGIGFIARAGDSMLFFPLLANKVLSLKINTGEMKCEKVLNEYYDIWSRKAICEGQKYYFVEKKREQLNIFSRIGRELLIYDSERGIIQKNSYILPYKYYKKRIIYKLKKHINEYQVVTENEYSLNDFLHMYIENIVTKI